MAGFLCIRSGRDRGCHVLPDPGTVPEQLALPEPDDVDQAAPAAPAGTSATSSPPESSPPADPATRGQLTALALAFADHGIGREQRADRLWLCSDHAGRPLTTSAHLSRAEAHALLERLHALPRGSLQRVLAARRPGADPA